jgi:triacylglycerol lipase
MDSSITGLIVVEHSMGGLAIRRYLQSEHHGGRISKVITVGTPHHGTLYASCSVSGDARW